MIATPNVDHICNEPYLDAVYEPAEDTFAFLDALEQDADAIRKARPRLVVEIGSGSGCVSAFLATILSEGGRVGSTAYVCSDINPLALSATVETGKRNGGNTFDVVQTNLLQAISERCAGQIDLLLFNPPYVPTTEDEESLAQEHGAIEGSWAGGMLGTTLVDRLMPSLPGLVAPGGRFYLVAIRQNDPERLVRDLQGYGFTSDICLSRRAGREFLYIIRAIKS